MPQFLALLCYFLFSQSIFGRMITSTATPLINITVDDTLGNPDHGLHVVYQPDGSWSLGQDCSTCQAHINTTKVFNGTWHDVSYLSDNPPSTPLTASLTFTGSAIYVFCIVTRSSTDPFGNSDMTFSIDGEETNTFVLPPNGDPTYHYSFPVYVNKTIPFGQHTFTLTNGRAGGQTALALLDYIVVSTEATEPNGTAASTGTSSPSHVPSSTSTTPNTSTSAPPQTPSHTAASQGANTHNTVAVVLSVLGAVLALTLITLLVLWIKRRRLNTRNQMNDSLRESHQIDSEALPSSPRAGKDARRTIFPFIAPALELPGRQEKGAQPPLGSLVYNQDQGGTSVSEIDIHPNRPLPPTALDIIAISPTHSGSAFSDDMQGSASLLLPPGTRSNGISSPLSPSPLSTSSASPFSPARVQPEASGRATMASPKELAPRTRYNADVDVNQALSPPAGLMASDHTARMSVGGSVAEEEGPPPYTWATAQGPYTGPH